MERLLQHYTRILANTNLDKHRYLFHQINWENRLIGITGARGTGKTTLLLQHIKQTKIENISLYVSLDNIYFAQHTLTQLSINPFIFLAIQYFSFFYAKSGYYKFSFS